MCGRSGGRSVSEHTGWPERGVAIIKSLRRPVGYVVGALLVDAGIGQATGFSLQIQILNIAIRKFCRNEDGSACDMLSPPSDPVIGIILIVLGIFVIVLTHSIEKWSGDRHRNVIEEFRQTCPKESIAAALQAGNWGDAVNRAMRVNSAAEELAKGSLWWRRAAKPLIGLCGEFLEPRNRMKMSYYVHPEDKGASGRPALDVARDIDAARRKLSSK